MRSLILSTSCLLAILGSSCVVATSSAFAKHKAATVEKHTSGAGAKRHASADSKQKQKAPAAKREKSIVSAKQEPAETLEPRTPTDKQDCIAVAQAFYGRAGTLSRQTKQAIPPVFVRVVSKLDEFCGEEEFDKARISIDWMNTCLQTLSSDPKTAACSDSEINFCPADPQSNACTAGDRRAER
jgi:hypothetical protein